MKRSILTLILLYNFQASAVFIDGSSLDDGLLEEPNALQPIKEEVGQPAASPTSSSASDDSCITPIVNHQLPEGYNWWRCAKDCWDAQLLRERSVDLIPNSPRFSRCIESATRKENRAKKHLESSKNCCGCCNCCKKVVKTTKELASATLPQRLTMGKPKGKSE